MKETRKSVQRTRRIEKLSSISKLQALGHILPIYINLKNTSTIMRTLVQLIFFKETHTSRKKGCMSTAALDDYTTMENKRIEAHQVDDQSVPDTQILAEVLKEHRSSSTFLSSIGYQSRSGRTRTSTSLERVRELEEIVEQQKREAIEAREMYQQ